MSDPGSSPTGLVELDDVALLEVWGAPPPPSAQPDGSSGQGPGQSKGNPSKGKPGKGKR